MYVFMYACTHVRTYAFKRFFFINIILTIEHILFNIFETFLHF